MQTAAEHDRFDLQGLDEFVGFIHTFLLVFGIVALVVGAFTIVNTLSITVAQRSRELALMSAIGATRRQVLRSVVLEAAAIGAIGSLIGLFAGLLLAKGLAGVFAATGVELPAVGTVFATRTIVVSLAAGMIVTLAASLSPALRATRVSPVAVMREGAELPQSRVGRRATVIAAVAGAARRGDPRRGRARTRDGGREPAAHGRARRAAGAARGGARLAADGARAWRRCSAARRAASAAPPARWHARTPCATRAARPSRPPR